MADSTPDGEPVPPDAEADATPDPPPRGLKRRDLIIGGIGLVALGFGLSQVVSGGGGSGSTATPATGTTPSGSAVTDSTLKQRRRRRDRTQDTTVGTETEDTRRRRRRDRDATDASTPGDEATTTHDMAAMEPSPGATRTAVAGAGSGRWSDPATWGGAVPVDNDVVAIERDVLLDVDATVSGVTVAQAGTLTFDPAASRRLVSSRNVVIAGTLVMRPSAAANVHALELVGVDESAFMGGHSDAPIESDIGLWITGNGLVDLAGTPKRSWTNLGGAAEDGDTSITVDDAAGWLVGDEVVITPTEPPTVDTHWEHHDRRTITSVSGSRIGLDKALEFPHPEVTVREGVVHRAEVLNLSRNVVINGRPEGRSHFMFLQTAKPQHMAHVAIHDMGPRQNDEEVLGRYAIHFHNCGNGSKGSTVDSVVVRDSTGHGFASHLSNGVTFTECVAHDMVDDAFWWDLSLDGQGRDLVPSDEIVYDRCVAHFVKSGANSKFNLTGFMMGVGTGNVARGCVATGVQGGAESSCGYNWPSLSRGDSTWTFEGNMAHNCHHSGIYFWQNGKPRAVIDGFTAYHCGQGIFAGAYANLASYVNSTIYACEDDGLIISALPAGDGERTSETIRYDGMYIDQAGLTEFAVKVTKHLSRGGRVTQLSAVDVQGRHEGPGRPARGRRPPAALRLHRLHVRGQRVLAGQRRATGDPPQRERGRWFLRRAASRPAGRGPPGLERHRRPRLIPTTSGREAFHSANWARDVTAVVTQPAQIESAPAQSQRGAASPSRSTRAAFEVAKVDANRVRAASGTGPGPGRVVRLTLTNVSGVHGEMPAWSVTRRNVAPGSTKKSSLRTTRRRSRPNRSIHGTSWSA